MGSQATRDADGVLFTRAGLEIGVAATKTFVCQVAAMYLLGLRLAELRGTLAPRAPRRSSSRELKRLPHCIDELIEACEAADRRRSRTPCTSADFFLYLGRHVGLPVALEGALKLKEISYIATDAYAAGEMKHGPIALLDEATPVVVRRHRLAGAREGRLQHPGGPRPRRARDRDRDRGQRGRSPSTPTQVDLRARAPTGCSQPLLAVIPLQLLAYRSRARAASTSTSRATSRRPSPSSSARGARVEHRRGMTAPAARLARAAARRRARCGPPTPGRSSSRACRRSS